MADETTTEETTEASTETGDLDDRVGRLEASVDKILNIVSGGGGKPEQSETPQQPGNIADEIRQQLDERDRRAKTEAEDAAKTDRLAALETKVSELAEKPPESMPRRIEKLMGWR